MESFLLCWLEDARITFAEQMAIRTAMSFQFERAGRVCLLALAELLTLDPRKLRGCATGMCLGDQSIFHFRDDRPHRI